MRSNVRKKEGISSQFALMVKVMEAMGGGVELEDVIAADAGFPRAKDGSRS